MTKENVPPAEASPKADTPHPKRNLTSPAANPHFPPRGPLIPEENPGAVGKVAGATRCGHSEAGGSAKGRGVSQAAKKPANRSKRPPTPTPLESDHESAGRSKERAGGKISKHRSPPLPAAGWGFLEESEAKGGDRSGGFAESASTPREPSADASNASRKRKLEDPDWFFQGGNKGGNSRPAGRAFKRTVAKPQNPPDQAEGGVEVAGKGGKGTTAMPQDPLAPAKGGVEDAERGAKAEQRTAAKSRKPPAQPKEGKGVEERGAKAKPPKRNPIRGAQKPAAQSAAAKKAAGMKQPMARQPEGGNKRTRLSRPPKGEIAGTIYHLDFEWSKSNHSSLNWFLCTVFKNVTLSKVFSWKISLHLLLIRTRERRSERERDLLQGPHFFVGTLQPL